MKKRDEEKKPQQKPAELSEEYRRIFQLEILPMREELYGLVLRNIQLKEDAEDVYQEIFEQCWKSIPKLRNQQSVRQWVYRIAKGTIADYYSSRLRNPEIPCTELVDEEPSKIFEIIINEQEDHNFIKYFLKEDKIEIVWRAFEDLDEKYRGIIWLWYTYRWSLKDVAAELDRNYNTVRVMFSRGIRKLRKKYKKIIEEEELDEKG